MTLHFKCMEWLISLHYVSGFLFGGQRNGIQLEADMIELHPVTTSYNVSIYRKICTQLLCMAKGSQYFI